MELLADDGVLRVDRLDNCRREEGEDDAEEEEEVDGEDIGVKLFFDYFLDAEGDGSSGGGGRGDFCCSSTTS